MMTTAKSLALVLVLAATGCSSSGSGNASSAGSSDWGTFQQLIGQGSSATFFFTSPSKTGEDWMTLIISSQADPCGAVANDQINLEVFELYDVRPSTATLSWTVFGGDTGVKPGPVPLGVPVPSSKYPPPASGQYGFPELSLTPAQCSSGDTFLGPNDISLDGVDLSFQLDAFAPDHAKGSYSIKLDQQTLTGQFDASLCGATKSNPDFLDCP